MRWLPILCARSSKIISATLLILLINSAVLLKVYMSPKCPHEYEQMKRQRTAVQRTTTPKDCGIGNVNGYLLPNDQELAIMTDQKLTDAYWKYVNTIQVICYNQTRLGSMKDGGKEICIDDLYEPRKPCLVYSFGSNFQFDFELAVIDQLGCEVHTFDPSKPLQGRSIPYGIIFHLKGLGGVDHFDRSNSSNGWQMGTLLEIHKELNHQNRNIDILKIDIEGWEWTALVDIFQSGILQKVKQINLEVHYGKTNADNPESDNWGQVPMTKQLRVLRQLYEKGFLIFMREHNLFSEIRSNRPHPSITTVNVLSFLNGCINKKA